VRGAGEGGAASFLEVLVEFGFEALLGGREAEEEAGAEGETEGKEQGGDIEAEGVFDGEVTAGHEEAEQVGCPPGDDETGQSAEQAEDEAFGEELPKEVAVAGADGQADGDFLLATEGAGEEEVGDIGDDDEEDAEADGGEGGEHWQEVGLSAVGGAVGWEDGEAHVAV